MASVRWSQSREGETTAQHDRYGSNDISRLTAEPSKNPKGRQVGFGKGLHEHIDNDDSHSPADAEERKKRLMFAVKTVTNPDKTEYKHRSIPGRTAYAKAFKDFGILAITEQNSETIEKVFTFFPRRRARKR